MGLLSFIIKAAAIAAVGGAVGVVGAAAISACAYAHQQYAAYV